jgi:hypothetical protein
VRGVVRGFAAGQDEEVGVVGVLHDLAGLAVRSYYYWTRNSAVIWAENWSAGRVARAVVADRHALEEHNDGVSDPHDGAPARG